jgi:hypothetical protein
VFTVAAVALALIEESAIPVPGTDKPRGFVIDRLYEAESEQETTDRLAWAIAAGGDV